MEQKRYYEKLIDVIDTPIYTAQNWKQGNQWKPGKQKVLVKSKHPIDHRTIGSNEVVIELDAKSYSQNYLYAEKIVNYLKGADIPHYCFWSGNKSIHIHIFLKLEIDEHNKEVTEVLKKAKEAGCNIYQEIRVAFAKEIVEQSGFSPHLIGHGKVVDLAKLKWNDLSGKVTLIRSCGGANIKSDGFTKTENWKTYYQVLPSQKPRKNKPNNFLEVDYPDTLDKYDIGQPFIVTVAQDFVDRLAPHRKSFKTFDFKGVFLNTPCNRIIREGLKAGQRNQGAKILAIACRKDNLTFEQAEEVLKEYVANCSRVPEPYEWEEASGWLKWIYNEPEVFWNCSLPQSIGICDKNDCTYWKEKNKEGMSAFKTETPLKLVKGALDKLIVGEEDLKMALFLLYLTKDYSPEWCILIDGPAASGKSHVMKAVASLFGEEDEAWHVMSRISATALNHLGDMADDWKNSIVIIEEIQGARQSIEQLRVAISEGKLTYVGSEEYKEDGMKGHQAKKKVVDLSNVLFVTNNAEELDEGSQLASRSWILNTDTSKEQTRNIIKTKVDLFSEMNTKEEREDIVTRIPEVGIIRQGMAILEQPDQTIFPFPDELRLLIPTSTVRARRDVLKLITLIKASAKWHQHHRTWIRTDTQNVLVADWRDVWNVYRYAGEALNSSAQGLGPKDSQRLNTIISELGGSPIQFDKDSVMRWCKIDDSPAKKLLANLCNAGFIENMRPPPMPGLYERTNLVPDASDVPMILLTCEKNITGQQEKIEEFVKKQAKELLK